ncbi:hypothetical protein ACFPAG_12265 [Vogesella sp. GCM10023246]|uniref:Uncharacterized protein n=1 Tax=Vogesella oryzagri TaxID=3160864 RepID=A0ABV1M730_9NEIS
MRGYPAAWRRQIIAANHVQYLTRLTVPQQQMQNTVVNRAASMAKPCRVAGLFAGYVNEKKAFFC